MTIQGTTAYGQEQIVSNSANSEADIGFKSANIVNGASGDWLLGTNIGVSNGNFSIWGGSDDLNVTTAGNVGIGTTTPGSIFSVNNVLNLTTATSTFYSTGGVNLTSGCFSIIGTCVSGSGGGGSGTVGSGTQGQFAFYNAAGTTLTATSSLFLAQSSNIGIGTTSPQVVLDVESTAPNNAIAQFGQATTNTNLTTPYSGTWLEVAQESNTAGNTASYGFTSATNNLAAGVGAVFQKSVRTMRPSLTCTSTQRTAATSLTR